MYQNVFEFKSSSSDSIYKVRQNGDKLKCDCPGTWRAKDRRCKHIKEVEKKLNIKWKSYAHGMSFQKG